MRRPLTDDEMSERLARAAFLVDHPEPVDDEPPHGVTLVPKRQPRRRPEQLRTRREPEPGTEPETFPTVLDTTQCARMLHVDESTVLRACKAGMPFRRVGKAHRYYRDAVLRWLAGETG